MDTFLILASAVVAALRIRGIKSIAFQAAAHLLVGGLIGAWLINRRRFHLVLWASLTIVEAICFLAGRIGG